MSYINDYIKRYIDELFKEFCPTQDRQERQQPEFVETMRFPTQATQNIAASARESSAAIREMARKLADWGKFVKTSSEVNIHVETSTIDARLSDDEWNNLMKNLGGK